MIGSMTGSEQFSITIKQYLEIYDGEIPDKILKDYLNNYSITKEKNEKGEKAEKSSEEIFSGSMVN